MRPGRFTLALAVLLVACSAPDHLERGVRPPTARPPPRAPTFRPNQDAPHQVGQPVTLGPRASGGGKTPTITAARVERPVARIVEGIPEKAWRRCWAEVQQCMNEVQSTSLLSDDDYECSRWEHLSDCGGIAIAEGTSERRWASRTYGTGWDMRRFGDYSNRQKHMVCKNARRGYQLNALNAKVADLCLPRWRKAFRE